MAANAGHKTRGRANSVAVLMQRRQAVQALASDVET